MTRPTPDPGDDAETFDCIVCGSCVLDLLCRPVQLDRPIGRGVLHQTQPLEVSAGGITANSGITLARLGLSVGVFSLVGDDAWAPTVRRLFEAEKVDTTHLLTRGDAATSTTVVAIDPSGERSFLHCVGAPRLLDGEAIVQRADLWRRTRYLLLGYYSLMPRLEPELPEALAAVRREGCKTAMDAAGDGGTMHPLEAILPHLDVWVPSLLEARHQTGHEDPQRIVQSYREGGAAGLVGVKLGGDRGVLLSPAAGEFSHVESCTPPGPVVDTTGAGDSFYAGLIAGLVRGLSVEEAGRLGTAAAACCVTALGGNSGGRGWDETAKIAGFA